MKRILLISLLLVLALSVSFGQIAYKKGDQVGSLYNRIRFLRL